MNETREPENGFENGDYIITPDMLTMLDLRITCLRPAGYHPVLRCSKRAVQ